MTAYIIRRLLAMIPALLGIALITFVLMHLTKGGPFESEHSNADVQAALMRAYHLDQPVWPTFLGTGAQMWQTVVLVLGIVILAVGVFAAMRRPRGYELIRPIFISVGVLMSIWY